MSPRELPLCGFAPVGLDELVSEAELMTRVDRKYLIPLDTAALMVAGLDPSSRVLEIAGRREHAYDSVYFDTADRTSYLLTAWSRRRRFKLRTRSYLDSGTAFLEVKTKSDRQGTVKDRIAYDLTDRARLTPEGRAFVSARLSHHGLDPELARDARPVLVSRYRRSTVLLPCGSRATIDTRLVWGEGSAEAPREPSLGASSEDPSRRTIRLDGFAIIESKSAGPPSALDRSLWRAGHRPSRISKFGVGMAALHPELPSNKWARLLSGPLSTMKEAA